MQSAVASNLLVFPKGYLTSPSTDNFDSSKRSIVADKIDSDRATVGY